MSQDPEVIIPEDVPGDADGDGDTDLRDLCVDLGRRLGERFASEAYDKLSRPDSRMDLVRGILGALPFPGSFAFDDDGR